MSVAECVCELLYICIFVCLDLYLCVSVCLCGMWGVHVCLCIVRQIQHPGERKLSEDHNPWGKFSAVAFFSGFKLFIPPLELTDSEYEKVLSENGNDII